VLLQHRDKRLLITADDKWVEWDRAINTVHAGLMAGSLTILLDMFYTKGLQRDKSNQRYNSLTPPNSNRILAMEIDWLMVNNV